MSRGVWGVCAGLLLIGSPPAWSQELDSAALRQVVEKATVEYCAAFAAGDAARIAALFTPEAEYVDGEGIIFHGRGAIADEYAASFANGSPGKIRIDLMSLRPIATGVLVEEGVSTFLPEGDGPSVRTHYSATHVRGADGNWLLASVRELEPVSLTPHDRLLALSWLIGGWREESEASAVKTEWNWSSDGNYLIAQFTVQRAGRDLFEGTHRVGWDAERKQFRSWVFDTAGGFAEGWWRENEDGSWSINMAQVNARGERSTAVLTYALDGEDAIIISQEQISRAGESQPSFAHRIVRRPPAPETVSLP